MFAKRIAGTKVSRPEAIMSVQDIAVQSQALINVKDSNKVCVKHAICELVYYFEHIDKWSFRLFYLQEDRERMVVRRFKFEEPRIEQIQDLEVMDADIIVFQFCLYCI